MLRAHRTPGLLAWSSALTLSTTCTYARGQLWPRHEHWCALLRVLGLRADVAPAPHARRAFRRYAGKNVGKVVVKVDAGASGARSRL